MSDYSEQIPFAKTCLHSVTSATLLARAAVAVAYWAFASARFSLRAFSRCRREVMPSRTIGYRRHVSGEKTSETDQKLTEIHLLHNVACVGSSVLHAHLTLGDFPILRDKRSKGVHVP